MDVFVADFGFARLKRMAESKGYTKTDFGPVRWEAPESLERKGILKLYHSVTHS